jgi:uncharacterized membrane protein YoaK (UPF0700 family)
MIRYSRRIKLLAAGLAALAGFVDATGFLKLGGFFVSFMSGNTTRLAVGLAQGTSSAAVAGGLIATFIAGVMAGTITGHFAAAQRAAVILALVCLLLAAAAGFGALGFSIAAVAAMTLAMGAINAVFAHGGEVHIGLTYMTGTLVKIGQHLAGAVLGGDPLAWWPYLLLWFGLACGAVCGALAFPYLGLNSLWLAAGAAALFAFTALRTNLQLALAPQPQVKRTAARD